MPAEKREKAKQKRMIRRQSPQPKRDRQDLRKDMGDPAMPELLEGKEREDDRKGIKRNKKTL